MVAVVEDEEEEEEEEEVEVVAGSRKIRHWLREVNLSNPSNPSRPVSDPKKVKNWLPKSIFAVLGFKILSRIARVAQIDQSESNIGLFGPGSGQKKATRIAKLATVDFPIRARSCPTPNSDPLVGLRKSIFAKSHFVQSEPLLGQKPTLSNPSPPSNPSVFHWFLYEDSVTQRHIITMIAILEPNWCQMCSCLWWVVHGAHHNVQRLPHSWNAMGHTSQTLLTTRTRYLVVISWHRVWPGEASIVQRKSPHVAP